MSLIGTAGDFNFNTNTTTVSKPAGSAAGHVAIWSVYNYATNGFSASINSPPAGWTQIGTTQTIGPSTVGGVTRYIAQAVFVRVFDGSEGSSFTATGSTTGSPDGMASTIVVYSTVDNTTPIDAFSQASGHGTPVSATSITVGASGNYLVCAIVAWETDRGPPTGFTNEINSGGNGITTNDKLSGVSSGATGAVTATASTTEDWSVFLISLKVSAGGTNTPKTITANQTQTASVTRQVTRVRSANQTQTASAVRSIGKNQSATQTQTKTIVRALGLIRSASQAHALVRSLNLGIAKNGIQTQDPGIAPTSGIATTITATQTQTPSRTRAVTPGAKTANQTQTPSRTRAVTLGAKTANQTQTPSLGKGAGQFKTITATVTQTSARALGVARNISASVAQSLTSIRAIARMTSASQTQTPSQSNTGGGTNTPKTITTTQTQTAAIARLLGLNKSGNETQSPTASRAASIGKIASQTQTPTRARTVTPGAKTAMQTQTPSLIKGAGAFKTISVVSTSIASLSKSVNAARTFVVNQTQTPTIGRAYNVTRSVVATQVPSRLRAIARAFVGLVTQTPSATKGQGAQYSVEIATTQTQTPIASRNVTRPGAIYSDLKVYVRPLTTTLRVNVR